MLHRIISKYQTSRNIREKEKLRPILAQIKKLGFQSSQIYASIGEDAAAIRLDSHSQELILVSTDALLPQFVQKSPFGAGFSAIYVGIDDIMVAGGIPIACTTTVSFADPLLGNQIFQGILQGTQIFQVPLIRGHTTTDAADYSLTSTMIGRTTIDHYVSGKMAEVGDRVVLYWDADGKPAMANKYYWDTITTKNSDEFYAKRALFKHSKLCELIHTAKDISNGGILGTLAQMLDYCQKGALLQIDELEAHIHSLSMPYSLDEFLYLFLTSAFLLTVPESQFQKVKAIATESKMQFCEIGTITSDLSILITYNAQKFPLFSIKTL